MQPIVPNDYSQEVAALIPPFPKSGKVLYRLTIETGGLLDAINEKNEVLPKQRVNGSPTSLTAQSVIYDPYKQQTVTINVSTSNRVQGAGANQFLAAQISYATFNELGDMELTSTNPQHAAMYRFMELLPSNKNNVLTGVDAKDENGNSRTAMPDAGWRVMRVEADKTARELADNQRLIDKVRAIIGDNTEAENRAIAARLPAHLRFNVSVTEDVLYSNLRAVAEKDPDAIYRATTDETTKLEALVNEAITGKIIEFDHVGRNWLRSASRLTLTAVPTGEPKDGLIAWLLDNQGATARAWLKGAVAESKKPAPKPPKKEGPRGMKIEEGQPIPEGYTRGAFGLYYPPATDNE